MPIIEFYFIFRQITQQEFTDMAWQGIVSSPDVAKENKHQIVETEHLMKVLLEQKNGLARRIFSKVGVDNTRLLEATDRFIQRQPKVMYCPFTPLMLISIHLTCFRVGSSKFLVPCLWKLRCNVVLLNHLIPEYQNFRSNVVFRSSIFNTI